jgi:acetyltransferase-like isoleucine patch superfamily enzyme
MPIDPASITVGDLFFNLKGIEDFPFFCEDTRSNELFSTCDDPWEPLNKLPYFFEEMLRHDPRCLPINDGKNLLVQRNKDCSFTCLQDVYDYIGPQAQIDSRSLRLRGGKRLYCDGSGKITGPTYIGPCVQIRHGGGILGSVVIGDGVTHAKETVDEYPGIGGIIGHGVTVRRSIIRVGTKIEAVSEIVDCIIGRDVYIDAGAQFPHENFSEREIVFSRMDGEQMMSDPRDCEPITAKSIRTGRTKLGCIIGDNCFIGANVTFHPGTMLLSGCRVPGGTTLEGGVYTPEFCSSL